MLDLMDNALLGYKELSWPYVLEAMNKKSRTFKGAAFY